MKSYSYDQGQVIIRFKHINGIETNCLSSPSKMSDDFGQRMIIRLNKDQSFNFIDNDGDIHQIITYRDSAQSILFYDDYFIYDAHNFTVTNHEDLKRK